jgi:Arc/MetJ-type ribon-helix-helix transcriptional regulator
MSTQIAVRLPDDLVAFVDEQVRTGQASSRADLVARLINRERRRAAQAREIEILRATADQPDPDDLASLHRWAARQADAALDER